MQTAGSRVFGNNPEEYPKPEMQEEAEQGDIDEELESYAGLTGDYRGFHYDPDEPESETVPTPAPEIVAATPEPDKVDTALKTDEDMQKMDIEEMKEVMEIDEAKMQEVIQDPEIDAMIRNPSTSAKLDAAMGDIKQGKVPNDPEVIALMKKIKHKADTLNPGRAEKTINDAIMSTQNEDPQQDNLSRVGVVEVDVKMYRLMDVWTLL
mmetsp:Transcript_25747/g.45709  ORF Transcript_25747/g.45709 Transcript_25747/m.45709 type:complete len:208 (-) Transcript_25747:152-775(-)|eukprot:CAMPEP_0197540534 /NCGR_PEP_ID=MMETSP1318-20131121/66197_1 /TAXON_ID=552666 /ORGANISM="Partenskyella glossopodia, Strain RCC365" /LENGTH=207 /DNA_ID=CAMNT_0043099563 /DNA_START=27 /DNA_END=650 /DNA_ORIENTATION=-